MRDEDGRVAGRGSTGDTEESEIAAPSSGTVSRRRALQVLGSIPILGPLAFAEAQQAPPQQAPPKTTHEGPNQPARDTKQPQGSQAKTRFFTAREMRTVRVLADDIIPRDERSGSATDAKVPEFIDFNLSVAETNEDTRTAWRGGLRWLDTESRKRFGVAYASAREAQRHAILDDISFPNGVPQGVPQGGIPPELRYGAAFFARARDMVASGFFSSLEGFKDLRYIGNVFNPNWKGCPPEALAKLGVSYDLMPPKAQ
jgi:gluconate 2-dehydrogenase gamma chain